MSTTSDALIEYAAVGTAFAATAFGISAAYIRSKNIAARRAAQSNHLKTLAAFRTPETDRRFETLRRASEILNADHN